MNDPVGVSGGEPFSGGANELDGFIDGKRTSP
jgi:hypothetical protein